jgi:hypothetical protein
MNNGDDNDNDNDNGETLHLLDSSFSGFSYQRHDDSRCYKMLSLFYADSDYNGNEEDASREHRVTDQCERIWQLQQVEKFQLHRFPHPTLPPGIGRLTTLKYLDISGAQRLTEISSDIGRLLNLTYLAIEGCPHLDALPVEIGDLASLEVLDMNSLQSLRTLPATIGRLRNLKELRIVDCDSLTSLPEEIGRLSGLKKLYLSSLGGLQSLPNDFGSGLEALEYLSVYECQQLTRLEAVHWQTMPNLATISITGCQSLETIPMELKLAKRMQVLNLSGTARDVLLQLFALPWSGGSAPGYVHLSAEHPQHPERQRLLREFQLGSDYGRILRGLPVSLVHLDFGYHAIDNLNGFLARPGLPRGVRSLMLEGNPILSSDNNDDRLRLLNLLNACPQLGCISSSYREKIITESTIYSLLLNRCGRILLVDNATKPLPLCMWPLVLKNVNRLIFVGVQYADRILDTLKVMEVSVMYALLRGPALLGRLAEGHDLALNRKRKQ